MGSKKTKIWPFFKTLIEGFQGSSCAYQISWAPVGLACNLNQAPGFTCLTAAPHMKPSMCQQVSHRVAIMRKLPGYLSICRIKQTNPLAALMWCADWNENENKQHPHLSPQKVCSRTVICNVLLFSLLLIVINSCAYFTEASNWVLHSLLWL